MRHGVKARPGRRASTRRGLAAVAPILVALAAPAGARAQTEDDRRPLAGNEPVLDPLRELLWEGGLPEAAFTEGAGTADIGEIAVLEDDGSLTFVQQGTRFTDTGAILDAFYQTHPDEYDAVVIFTASSFSEEVEPEAGFAFFAGLAQHTAGLNQTPGSVGQFSLNRGLTRALGVINMNDLTEFPSDPNGTVLGGVASGVEILGQEFGHAYGAFVQAAGADILGRSDAHWSFYLHHPGEGNASPLEGNRWVDNGDGTFTTVESFTGLSELDEYLLGLRPPANVSPFFLVEPSDPDAPSDSTFPASGFTVAGTRTDLTINDVTSLNGLRDPSADESMSTFRTAFVLVIPQGTTASSSDLEELDAFRLAWEDYFATESEGLGAVDTSLLVGPAATLPFEDDFSGGPKPDVADWVFFQGATVDGGGLNEPSGTTSLRLDGAPGGGDEIRSRVIDLSAEGASGLSLVYQAQRAGSAATPGAQRDLLVEYFNSASEWLTLRVIPGDGSAQSAFTTFKDPLPPDAFHDRFRIRLRRQLLSGAGSDFGAFFVDDVRLALPCPADLDDNQVVDGADLGLMLLNWDPIGPAGSAADLNGDQKVDGADLGMLLLAWGSCS